jgi:long-chain acyl-CoA synthetase
VPRSRSDLLAIEVERQRKRWVEEELRRVGEERSRLWGWPNTYTYSKGLAERLIVAEAGDLDYAIVRPAIIESAVQYPEPGWNEGVNTSAPIIFLAWRGFQNMPSGPGLIIDFIPVDHITAGMLMISGALLAGCAKRVYHLSTSECNPIPLDRIVELTALAHRKIRRKTGAKDFFETVKHHLLEVRPVEMDTYRRVSAPAVAKLAGGIKSWLGSVKAPAALRPVLGAAKDAAAKLERQSRTIDKAVHTFLPYIYENDYRFRSHNVFELRDALPPAERELLAYTPEKLDWRSYWVDLHVPGLHRFTLPQLEEKLRKKPRQVHTYADLRELFHEATERYADQTALRLMTPKGVKRVTYRRLRQMADLAGARLRALGAVPGSRVVLLSENRPEWSATYFGITLAGATCVPVDPAIDAPTLETIVGSSRAVVAVVSERCAERLGHDLKNILAEAACHRVLITELYDEAFGDPAQAAETALAGRGERYSFRSPPAAPPEAAGAMADNIASLIYTSGTTGNPKGVMLSHANFTGLLRGVLEVFSPLSEPRFVSVLPLHHTFELMCGLLTPIARGGQITYLEELNAKELGRAFASSGMTHMVGVPALWQLLARSIEGRAAERGERGEKVFRKLLDLNRTLQARFGVNLGPVLLAPVHRFFGGHSPMLISGGASLPEPVLKTFQGLGLKLLEGYGLTEAAPVLTVNPPSRRAVVGSVGRPVPGVEIRVHEPDEHGVGEIIARSPGIMQGYDGRPDETARVIQDGWLHTGDLGRVDRRGYVHIVGRKKDVILDASGENVYPDELEELYGSHALVAELSVVGLPDGRGGEHPAAMAVVDVKAAEAEGLTPDEARRRVKGHIDSTATRLPRHKRLHLLRFSEHSLPRTATRKVKRTEIVKMFERLLAAEKQAQPPRQLGAARRGPAALWEAVARVSGRPIAELDEAQDLVLDLGLDSLELVELQALVEERCGARLTAQAVATLRTIGDVVDLIEGRGARPRHVAPARGHGRVGKMGEEHPAQPVLPVHGAPVATGMPVPAAASGDAASVDRAQGDVLPEPVAAAGRRLLGAAREAVFGRALDVQVYGKGHIPRSGRFIAAANHSSHLDTGVVLQALGEAADGMATLAAKDYFFDTPLKARLARQLTNLVPLERNGAAAQGLDEAGRVLEAGKSLLVYPEGTRSPSGRMGTFRAGVGLLALRHRMDVLPIHIEGTHSVLPKGAVLPRGRRVTVRIGKALPYRWLAEQTQGLGLAEAAAKVAGLVEQAVVRLSKGLYRLEDEQRAGDDLPSVLGELQARFQPAEVEQPMSFYLSLGEAADEKWTLHVGKDAVDLVAGKNGGADCVIKTSGELFRKIVREKYMPDMEDFMSGRLKTSDPGLLMAFQRVFGLG